MPRLPKISGTYCVKILCKQFGFAVVRRSGSHVVLKKKTSMGYVGTVVPIHSELKLGTLKGILRLARISEDEFCRFIK